MREKKTNRESIQEVQYQITGVLERENRKQKGKKSEIIQENVSLLKNTSLHNKQISPPQKGKYE